MVKWCGERSLRKGARERGENWVAGFNGVSRKVSLRRGLLGPTLKERRGKVPSKGKGSQRSSSGYVSGLLGTGKKAAWLGRRAHWGREVGSEARAVGGGEILSLAMEATVMVLALPGV